MKHLLKLPLCALAFAMTANTGFAQSSATGLKDAYKDYFSIGVAVNMQNITNPEQIAIIKKRLQQHYGRERHEAATHRTRLRTIQLGKRRQNRQLLPQQRNQTSRALPDVACTDRKMDVSG